MLPTAFPVFTSRASKSEEILSEFLFDSNKFSTSSASTERNLTILSPFLRRLDISSFFTVEGFTMASS